MTLAIRVTAAIFLILLLIAGGLLVVAQGIPVPTEAIELEVDTRQFPR
jgi:hypothetical protein